MKNEEKVVLKIVKEKFVNKFTKKEWKKFNVERYGKKGFSVDNQFKKIYTIAALYSRQIIGMAKFKMIGGVGVLETIIVKKNFRNKGIGQKILKRFEDICKKSKCHKLRLSTEAKSDAFEFYKKNGYKVEARLKKDYMNRDRVYMAKMVK